MRMYEEVVASAAAGCASTILGHPLDCVKVRMQMGNGQTSAATVCAEMLRREGVSAFSRGIGTPLANAILMNSVMFVTFAEARRRLPEGGAVGALLAGAFSGIVQATLSTPMDWAKIQAQVHGGSSAFLLLQTLRTRPALLLTGHWMNLWREGVFTAIYLGLYSHVRHALDPQHNGTGGLPLVALTSACTGALAWIACYPFDTVKSLQQGAPPTGPAAKRTAGACARALHANGGLRAFYRGAGSSTFRAMLVTCSRLVAYEAVAQRWFGGSSV